MITNKMIMKFVTNVILLQNGAVSVFKGCVIPLKNSVSYSVTACVRVCVLVYILLNDVSVLKFTSMLKRGNFNYIYEPRHEISNSVVCATSKGSDQPAHTRSLIRAFASRLDIL